VRLGARLFAGGFLLLAATVVGLVLAADSELKRHLEDQIAEGLEREARLVAALLPADSLRWPDAARELGARIGHRVTLIDSGGRVRGDTEFDRAVLARLENHSGRPEVRDALARGAGRDQRLSASTNERRMYVAVRGGPPGLVVVRLSTTLAAVDAEVWRVQRAVVATGLGALLAAAVLAWLLSRTVARPLEQLADAARRIAAGAEPVFPDSRVPEISEHILALRAMHEQLVQRFAELVREREETRALIETMSDGVIAADASGAVVIVNPAARRLLGYRPSDTPPPFGELFHDKSLRDFAQALLEGREVGQREVELEGRALLLSGRSLPAGGALLVFHDVTERRRLEAMRRDFVANVSHELKTPLTSIAGYAETLAGEASDPRARQFAQTVLNSARRMQRLVDDLLELSRIESGHWQPAPERVDVAAAVREAWAPLGDRAREGGVQLELAVAPAAAALRVDPDALRQVLTNLFHNALRHTPPGGGITVLAERTPQGTRLAVRDTGSGIASEHLPRIFERFYRADPGRSRDHGGTGLGLAIVKHLVEAHGGRVEADSGVGRGTTIHLYFPPEPPVP
jgi:two-component system phosphate regulon sensor histidine kinase PhoR